MDIDTVGDKAIDVDNSGDRVAISDQQLARELDNETAQANAVQLPPNGEQAVVLEKSTFEEEAPKADLSGMPVMQSQGDSANSHVNQSNQLDQEEEKIEISSGTNQNDGQKVGDDQSEAAEIRAQSEGLRRFQAEQIDLKQIRHSLNKQSESNFPGQAPPLKNQLSASPKQTQASTNQTREETKIDPSLHIQEQQQQQQQRQQNSTTASSNSNAADDTTSIFECNICLDTAKEPVVSQCGHLYCWPCIYQWLNQPRDQLVCPVCKSGITKQSMIPIYTKGNKEDPRKKGEQTEDIPNRPQGARSAPQPNRQYQRGGGLLRGNGSSFVMGFGIFPTLFSLNFTWEDIAGANNLGENQGNRANGANREQTREEQIQRFLVVFIMFMIFSFITFGSDVFLTF